MTTCIHCQRVIIHDSTDGWVVAGTGADHAEFLYELLELVGITSEGGD